MRKLLGNEILTYSDQASLRYSRK